MVDAKTIANSGLDLQVDKIRRFQVRSDDMFVITYPKSGTTWMKELVPLVLNGGDIEAIKDIASDVRMPYINFALTSDPLLKQDLAELGVIYVSRNPKDVAVSCFHFVQAVTSSRSSPGYENFSAFLPDFISAKNDAQCVIYDGSLWKDHFLHWWSRRHDMNVLFMFYEDMKQVKLVVGRTITVAESELFDTHYKVWINDNDLKMQFDLTQRDI
uniref:Amine sulfotransferase-like n=1 Tax=Saccoglossus kowalevskii TaxID=10224 RepID=A0ABM0M451_SACKO|nr:PREDICTED: amine sulfotransferase-like [Saccoglossus kowalevskii]